MEAPCKKSAKGMKMTPSSSSSSSSCFIANLPTPILMEILCRLPIKTLTASKSVCKSWLHLYKDPEFLQLHQARAPTEVCFQDCHDLYSVKLHLGNFHFLDNFDDVKLNSLFEFPKFSVRPNNDLNLNAVKGAFHFANSCNGLLCYYGGPNRFAVVWNPCTSEIITLPALNKNNASSNCRGYGLGFSRKANKYKLLRVVGQKGTMVLPENVEAEICTIEEECYWKTIGPCPSDAWQAIGYCSYNDPLYATFLHGALHWLSDFYGSGVNILSFDFEDDQFGRVALPRSFVKTKWNTYSLCRVGELGGCLFITDYTNEGVNIWLMKEYGVQDSWTKIFFLGFTMKTWVDQKLYLPITYMGNGEILMTCTAEHSTNVLFYNPVLKSFRVVGSCSGTGAIRVIAYRPSLVLLKDSMLGYKCAKAMYVDLEQGRMCTSPNWWSPVKKSPPQQGTEVEEEREGHFNAVSESSVSGSSVGMSAHEQGTTGGESHGLIQISTSVMSAQESSAAELALMTDEICASATMEDPMEPIKTMMEERAEQQELEERLRSDFAEVETLKEQVEQLKQQNQKLEEQIQESKQLKQRNQELEERLQIEHAKVKQLKEQIQQSKQLKQESRQKTIQMMEEMKTHIMGSH